MVPAPAVVRLKLLPPSLTAPLIVRRLLAELFVHVWLAPRITLALIVSAPEVALTEMPLPAGLPFKAAALIVSAFVPAPEAMVEPAVLAVPAPVKVRLLTVKA